MADTSAASSSILPDGLLALSSRRLWSSIAPSAVRTGAWEAWAAHLGKQASRRGLAGLASGAGHPLLWAMPDAVRRTSQRVLRELLDASAKPRPSVERRLNAWLAATEDRGVDLPYAFEALAWAYDLPRLASQVRRPTWWRLVDHLLHAARHATHVDGQSPLVAPLLGGELSLVLAAVLPEVNACRQMARRGQRTLAASRKTLALGVGLPHARHHVLLRTLLACWTRGRLLDGPARLDRHFLFLLRNAIRLARPNGDQVLCDDGAGRWNPELFAAALAASGSRLEQHLAGLRLPLSGSTRAIPLPPPALHCREAATTVLRTAWDRGAPQLSVCYPESEVQLELSSGTDVLLSGTWQTEVTIDSNRLDPVSPWREIGWVTDKDVDYLELELCLQAGVRVQRHLLLARSDQFLYLADAVIGAGPGKLEYLGRLPFARGCKARPARESRECYLHVGRQAALVLPLSLPEWREQSASGQFTTRDGLELREQSPGANLFAPLFIDLDRGRLRRAFTWRRLTVGQDRQVLTNQQAVGYRVQCGPQQWLLYRSLVRPANRTVLGHNLVSETLVGRFTKAGLVEPLLEIEVAQTGTLLPAEQPHTRHAHIGQEGN